MLIFWAKCPCVKGSTRRPTSLFGTSIFGPGEAIANTVAKLERDRSYTVGVSHEDGITLAQTVRRDENVARHERTSSSTAAGSFPTAPLPEVPSVPE